MVKYPANTSKRGITRAEKRERLMATVLVSGKNWKQDAASIDICPTGPFVEQLLNLISEVDWVRIIPSDDGGYTIVNADSKNYMRFLISRSRPDKFADKGLKYLYTPVALYIMLTQAQYEDKVVLHCNINNQHAIKDWLGSQFGLEANEEDNLSISYDDMREAISMIRTNCFVGKYAENLTLYVEGKKGSIYAKKTKQRTDNKNKEVAR